MKIAKYAFISQCLGFFTTLALICIFLFSTNWQKDLSLRSFKDAKPFEEKETTEAATLVTSIAQNSLKKLSNEAMILEMFAQRRKHVEDVCKRYKPNYRIVWESLKKQGLGFPYSSLVVNSEKRAIMCIVLKAGSTSWHNLFWQFRNPISGTKEPFFGKTVSRNYQTFQTMKINERIDLWQHPNTTILVNVRHPFARLISGWSDKFTKRYYYDNWFKQFPALNKYKSTNKPWNGTGHFMEWKDFARYIADYGKDPRNLDEHFRPATYTCDPCRFPFNFIVKAETFPSSEKWLLEKRLNASVSMLTRFNSAKQKNISPVLKIREYFSQLNNDTVKRIYEVYKYEMEVFGYTFDVDTLTAGGWNEISFL